MAPSSVAAVAVSPLVATSVVVVVTVVCCDVTWPPSLVVLLSLTCVTMMVVVGAAGAGLDSTTSTFDSFAASAVADSLQANKASVIDY